MKGGIVLNLTFQVSCPGLAADAVPRLAQYIGAKRIYACCRPSAYGLVVGVGVKKQQKIVTCLRQHYSKNCKRDVAELAHCVLKGQISTSH